MSDNNTLVLNSLKSSPNGLTAYQILNLLQKTKPIKPMTIYRSLENLTKVFDVLFLSILFSVGGIFICHRHEVL